jgi:hypothetical protein
VVVVVFVVVVVLRWHEAVMRNGINGALSFWSVEEIVGEFGKRARACGTVAEHAVQCSAMQSRVPSRLGTDRQTQIHRSIHRSRQSTPPLTSLTSLLTYSLTPSLTQSLGPQNTWTDLFIFYIEDLGGKI